MGCGGSKTPLTLQPFPPKPKYKVAIIGYNAPNEIVGKSDKDRNGNRYDSIPIANGLIGAGCTCALINYTPDAHEEFVQKAMAYDGLIVRINPGQLSAPGVDPEVISPSSYPS